MQYIKKNCSPISVEKLVYYFKNRMDFPCKPVLVTFDDGFENNYTVAAPILDELKIPAAFYISTSFIDSNNMFWVDEIEDCINRTSVKKLSLPYFSKPFFMENEENKINVLITIKDYCKTQKMQIKDEIINALVDITGVKPEVGNCKNYRKIRWSHLREMNTNPLFTIGGHSHTHAILSQISNEELDFEIEESVRLLEENLNKKIRHYSYPEGQEHHFNKEVIDKLQSKGIECCPTAIHGLNPKHTDLFYLKRIMVGFMNNPFPYYNL